MRLGNSRQSNNVEDRRSGGPRIGGRGTIGIGTIVLALVAMYFGVDPRVVLDMAEGPAVQEQAPATAPPANDPQAVFVSKVLGETEDVWNAIFQKELNRQYVEPKLVLFRGATPTACGTGQSAMGPFYCPGDSKVYIDLSFFDELQNRFKAPGDFAQAYVIAHEVGHHVQHLLGISDQVDQLRRRNPSQANALSVRLELQADCFAGLWAQRADAARNRPWARSTARSTRPYTSTSPSSRKCSVASGPAAISPMPMCWRTRSATTWRTSSASCRAFSSGSRKWAKWSAISSPSGSS